ncbi:MAG: type II toxin-antitoxin system Phd/YefM family antitoxin [bacterium]|nr:type II toxin-antitoxin system Phd/YefM family antitoxin [bacterium]
MEPFYYHRVRQVQRSRWWWWWVTLFAVVVSVLSRPRKWKPEYPGIDSADANDQNGHMKTTGIAEIKAHLSEYLKAVKAGEEVLVTERGVPIARLTPLPPATASVAGLEELERAGLLRRPTRGLPAEFWEQSRPEDPEATVRAALEGEREEGW